MIKEYGTNIDSKKKKQKELKEMLKARAIRINACYEKKDLEKNS